MRDGQCLTIYVIDFFKNIFKIMPYVNKQPWKIWVDFIVSHCGIMLSMIDLEL